MSEFINRDETYQRLHDAGGCGATEEWAKGYDDGITEAIRIINEMPAADVAPVVHGHWKYKYERHYIFFGTCSVCEHVCQENNVCGSCGAIMDESEDSDDEGNA